jgi:Zn-dependent protease
MLREASAATRCSRRGCAAHRCDLSRHDLVTIWVIPVIVAIAFHETARGFVAHLLGDDTAWRLGRVSFNPVRHIDPFGTILLPGILLLAHASFLFGYAKPRPVAFRALRSPRRDMILVAAAGPALNIAPAIVAPLAFHEVAICRRRARNGWPQTCGTR